MIERLKNDPGGGGQPEMAHQASLEAMERLKNEPAPPASEGGDGIA
jgi:hypothetical protein